MHLYNTSSVVDQRLWLFNDSQDKVSKARQMAEAMRDEDYGLTTPLFPQSWE